MKASRRFPELKVQNKPLLILSKHALNRISERWRSLYTGYNTKGMRQYISNRVEGSDGTYNVEGFKVVVRDKTIITVYFRGQKED